MKVSLVTPLALLCSLAAPDARGEEPARAARPLVVLDPGHGGTNSGAPTIVAGVYEKELTLALARQLRRELQARDIDVVLTRDRDVYLTLRQRVHHANQVGADLFLSLHTNASASHGSQGYETYVLSADGLDVDARALRQADGPARPGVDPAVAVLLDDLERGAAQGEAADLAVAVQAALRRVRGPGGDRGVKQAAMDVLMGATMPAVLIEVGFADHPIEGRQLLEDGTRAAIAAALAEAVTAHLQARAR